MSLYTLTEYNIPKHLSYLNWNCGKLNKFNKLYDSKTNISCKNNNKNKSLIKKQTKQIIIKPVNPQTHIKKAKTKSLIFPSNTQYLSSTIQSYYLSNKDSNSSKIKNKFNPDILDTQLISKPQKLKKKRISLDINKYKTFLKEKTRNNSLYLNTFNYINGNYNKSVTSTFMNKPIICRNIRDIKRKRNENKINYSLNRSMKTLIEKFDKSSKKAKAYMMTQYEQRLYLDKKVNLKEYNNFMKELQKNLSKSKSKSKPKKNFCYEYI